MSTAAGLAAAGPLVGCGSSSGPSRAQFAQQANAICKRVNDQITALGSATTAADVRRIGPGVLAAEQRGLADLKRVKAPSNLASDWRRVQADLTQLTANAGKLIDAAASGTASGAQSIATASQTTQDDLTKVAGRDGLVECAKG